LSLPAVGVVEGGGVGDEPFASGRSVAAMLAARSPPSFTASASPMWPLFGQPSPSIANDCAAQEISALKDASASSAAMPSPIGCQLPP
jgi:hypothetical protein